MAGLYLTIAIVLLILLPGMDGTGKLFGPFIECLPKCVETKIISYPKERWLSYEDLEIYVVSQLPATGDYIIVAESFSGPIALKIAGKANSGLKGVVLVCSFAYWPIGRLGLFAARLPLRMIFRMAPPDWLLRMLLLDRSASVKLLTEARMAIKRVRPEVLSARLKDALASNYCMLPVNTSVRVVAIFGDKDRLLGRVARNSILQVCPTAETEFVATCHLALQSNPVAVLRVLLNRDVLPS